LSSSALTRFGSQIASDATVKITRVWIFIIASIFYSTALVKFFSAFLALPPGQDKEVFADVESGTRN
jgi:hypothetical protein